ncbi:DUF4190 domain-containing protein [Aeromicrobium sp. CTD01-1L150]|uniref:DUF4190 domain-containing protein n=1 Tax=Aeromicrobium sp. CTD01-1L150 TaxID=3341830 RepID=UPI0035C09A35
MTSNTPPPGDPQDPQQPGNGSDLPSYGSVPPPPGDGSYPPPPPGGGDFGAAPQTNKKALWSMILGIVGLLCCGILLGIPAIILSVIGKREIAESGGRQTGGGMATAGLILGIIAVAWSVIYGILLAAGVVDLSFSGSTDTTF